MSNTSYSQYIESIAQQFAQLSGQSPVLTPLVKPTGISDQPRILILSPHPDDECLMAGYALRMQEEWSAEVTVVPFSYGSDVSKRAARSQELKEALSVLGFKLLDPRKNQSMDKLSISEFSEAVTKINPEIIFSPHANDRHPTHVQAYEMAASVVASVGASAPKKITWIQTEYWQAAEKPNLFIPLTAKHVVKIGEALMKHRGEIARNPYHLSLPAWYMDQARRAPELISGFGKSSSFIFGQLVQIK